MSVKNWIPEILYEENDKGITSGFPFIEVPDDKNMPSCLFICESRKVKEENSEIEKEVSFHCFANMTILKQQLPEEQFDLVRVSLGLKPLKEAVEKGNKITEDISKKLNSK